MTKVQAAVGLVQLRRLDAMIARRVRLARLRAKLLEGVPGLVLPHEPRDCRHTYYLFTLMVPRDWAGKRRDEVVRILKKKYRVGCIIANPPTYTENSFIRSQTRGQRLPLSEEIGQRIFCPSLHPLMTDAQNEYIAAAVTEAVDRVRKKGT
jgi:dTDP-4-amino-4,6-dideoxygalactose transaminase